MVVVRFKKASFYDDFWSNLRNKYAALAWRNHDNKKEVKVRIFLFSDRTYMYSSISKIHEIRHHGKRVNHHPKYKTTIYILKSGDGEIHVLTFDIVRAVYVRFH